MKKNLNKRRVWALYRVSTKKQISAEDDIPMQKKACHDFVKNQPNWEITNEIHEKGISGWSTNTDDRDALNEIKEEAIKGSFDILLVFMLDRLGRREDETPLVINFLHQHGIEVWSVKEGKRSVETHVDKLITYINFWQASGESLKTSIRVRESKKQLSKEGYYQGGSPPYGYKVIDTGQPHWKYKDRTLKELAPDEYESKVVKQIYDLYVNKHLGYRKICDRLNELYKPRSGEHFHVNTVQRVLTNKIYIGYRKYNSYDGEMEYQPYNEKLRIVSDELYYKAQEIRTKRKDSLKDQNKENIPLAGKLMFSGLAYCAYCGTRLHASYLYRTYKVKDKKTDKVYEYVRPVYRYRCPLNKGNINHDKSLWGAKKHDKELIEGIKETIALIDIENFVEVNIDKKKEQVKLKEVTLNKLKKEKEGYEKQLTKLNTEIANSLMGNSVFTPEQLSTAIDSINNQIKEVDEKIEKLKEEIKMEKDNYSEEKNISEEIKNWSEKFDGADDDLKKAMLSRIIKRVEFARDSFNIQFKYNIDELIELSNIN